MRWTPPGVRDPLPPGLADLIVLAGLLIIAVVELIAALVPA